MPTSTTTPISTSLGAFVGSWGAHFGGFTINADGTGIGSWRVYRWCTDSPTPPCDAVVNNNIVDGGQADIRVTAVHGNVAFAAVLHTWTGAYNKREVRGVGVSFGDQIAALSEQLNEIKDQIANLAAENARLRA
jgi:hypothetical protein